MAMFSAIAPIVAAMTALPAMTVVAPLPVDATPAAAKPWCDMAAHIAKMQPVAMPDDPVFRRPSDEAKAALGAVRKDLLTDKRGPKRRRAIARLKQLVAGPDGPVLARLALQDASVLVRLPGLVAALPLADRHPRLAAFAGHDVSHADGKVAAAAARVLLASGCDTSASYALDGLDHPDAQTRLSVALAVIETTKRRADMGLLTRVLDHIGGVEKEPQVVAAIARSLGRVGWLPAAKAMRSLLKHPDATVRCEAAVAQARITSTHDSKAVEQLVRSKSPYLRVCAARVLASGAIRRADGAIALLETLKTDGARATDPLQPKSSMVVKDAAMDAIAHLKLSK